MIDNELKISEINPVDYIPAAGKLIEEVEAE